MLDVMMPKISGLELLKQIKADSSLKAIPVVMLSNLSTAGENMRGQALKLGAADYVIKSEYGPEELVQKINQYL
jgi:two-component system phosphate regulon response regulator PhoB